MRVLVTGGSGFLGSHVADALCAEGHDVVLFDKNPSKHLAPNQQMVLGSVLDQAALAKAVAKCDIVYHFAAMADIDEAINNPRKAVETNVIGTLNLLEAARDAAIERFVYASSIYVYSNQGSFYRTTKQASENLLLDFNERYGLSYTVLRFGSLYGPRAGAENSIHRLLAQALEHREITYAGTGDEVREYIHVSDAASMAVDILETEFANKIIHLTGRERMKTREIMEMIGEMLGEDVKITFSNESMTGHYVQTPYSYTPRVGRKLTKNTYVDLGLGLLECIQTLDATRDSDP